MKYIFVGGAANYVYPCTKCVCWANIQPNHTHADLNTIINTWGWPYSNLVDWKIVKALGVFVFNDPFVCMSVRYTIYFISGHASSSCDKLLM